MDYWLDDKGQQRPKYHAQIAGVPGLWSCGRSPDEAIGGLINRHTGLFNLEVERLGKLAR